MDAMWTQSHHDNDVHDLDHDINDDHDDHQSLLRTVPIRRVLL
jgi:hypothetical protein